MHQLPLKRSLEHATRPEILTELLANPYLSLSVEQLANNTDLEQLSQLAEHKVRELNAPANTDDTIFQEWKFWVVLGQYVQAKLVLERHQTKANTQTG